MKQILLFLLTPVLFSCSSQFDEVDGQKFRLSVTQGLSEELVIQAENFFIENDSNFTWVDFEKIKAIRLDSNYFSYQLYIEIDNFEDSSLREKYKPVTELISEDVFHDNPVHIFLTKPDFETVYSVAYTKYYWEDKFTIYNVQNIHCKAFEPLSENFCYGIIDMLNQAYPPILNNTDTLIINSEIINEQYVVDVFLKKSNIKVDSLIKSFSKYPALPFNLLFQYHTGIINFRDMENDSAVFKRFGYK